ncbi:hypothetical protein DFH09DRAFT_1339760 [Mycena vulgaris]|nr:hypothetical protein DFH09DRAFT_1339760 [Mycena vulgaris]
MPSLQRRTLRSGKEYSVFDLAVGAPIEPAEFFDLEHCLAGRLDELEGSCPDEPADLAPATLDDPDSIKAQPFWINPPALDPLPAPASTSTPPKQAALKRSSKCRCNAARAAAAAAAEGMPPLGKGVAQHHVDASLANSLHVDVDISLLAHSKPAFIGLRSAEEEGGLGGRMYTREEIEALTGAKDLRYINWLGRISLPIIDAKGRIIAVLGGMPKDIAGWKIVTDTAARLFSQRVWEASFTEEDKHHRRAQEPFPQITCGLSYGGGQTELGELRNNDPNTRLSDDFLRHPAFQRLAGFANCLFAMFAPVLFAFYRVFAACTFNFGPHTITVLHLDFANLSWGWCAITALGNLDPDLGGHLILWDLKLVIRFPPGSTILIPSAIIRHSNVPVGAGEERFSFTQYTAGGLFRWIRNGFQTDEAWEKHPALVKESDESKKLAADQRREVDADYRERQRQKKWIKKHGPENYQNFYMPLYRIHSNRTGGLPFEEESLEDERARLEREDSSDEGGDSSPDNEL